MRLARVAGQVWGAKQAEGLQQWRLVVCQPLTARLAATASAVDSHGASSQAKIRQKDVEDPKKRAQKPARGSGGSLSGDPLSGDPLSVSFDANDAPLALHDQSPIIAVDALGAGPGELVLVAHGSRCRDLTLGVQVPTKDVVVAIVDAGQIQTLSPGTLRAEGGAS